MRCPVCKNPELTEHTLEAGLDSRQCPQCNGHWLPSYQYWKWRESVKPDVPEIPGAYNAAPPLANNPAPKLCPECRHILLPYRVGHGLAFTLDHCGHCGGTWFDRDEWETLKQHGLHNDAHLIFSTTWQRAIFQQERAEARERLRLEHFGVDDLTTIRSVKAWLNAHPKKSELIAYLLNPKE